MLIRKRIVYSATREEIKNGHPGRVVAEVLEDGPVPDLGVVADFLIREGLMEWMERNREE